MSTNAPPNPLHSWISATKGKLKTAPPPKPDKSAAPHGSVQTPPSRPTTGAPTGSQTPKPVVPPRPMIVETDDGEKIVFEPRKLPPPQKIAAKETLWSRDFGSVVAGRLPWLKMTGYLVELRVNGDVLDVLAKEDGGATSGLMIADAQRICDDFAKQFIVKVESLKGGAKTSMPELLKKAQDIFKEVQPKLAAEIDKVPRARWIKFQTDRPVWKAYKMETATNVAMGTLEIAIGATAVAAAVPTMGATLPLAVIETARGLFQTITEVASYVRSAESDQKELEADLKELQKQYLKGEGEHKEMTLKGKAQEVGAVMLKGFLGANVPLFVASLQKCNEIHERWKPKVAHLRILFGKGTKGANDLIADADDLEKKLTENAAKIAKEKAEKIHKEVTKMRVQVTKCLDKLSDLGGRVVKAEDAEGKLEEGLKELNQANPNYIKVFTVLFPAAVSIGLAAGTAGLEIAGAEETLEAAKAAFVLAGEVGNAIREAAG